LKKKKERKEVLERGEDMDERIDKEEIRKK